MSSMNIFRAALASITLLAATAMPAAGAPQASAPSQTCGIGQPAVVVGNDNAAVDVAAIQSAVDNNASVLLHGTFDFGDTGRVLLTRDVEICGEADDSGVPLTTIRRGQWDFHTPYPSVMPPPSAGPNVAIKHIHFLQSKGTAIHLAYSGGAAIVGNVIDEMRARQVNSAVAERAAIVVGPAILGGIPNTQFVPRLVSGAIEVSDNRIDVSGPESTTATRG